MKNNILLKSVKYLGVIFTTITIFSCSKGELVTGSPVDSNVEFATLVGSITTPDSDVVANQSFPVTVSIGAMTFPMDVSVEAIAFLPNSNKRSRKAFIIPAGESSITSTMVAPSGDATCILPFNLDLKLYLSAITTAPEVTPKGFVGKQYSIVSDTIYLGYGDTSIPGVNSKRLGVRFDFEGPYSGAGTNFNNLNIVLKKNGAATTSQSSMQGVSPLASTSRPLFGTLTNAGRYEQIYFLDTNQAGSLSCASAGDFAAGLYTVKTPNSNVQSNDKPHGFKVGDVVSINSIAGTSVTMPITVEITAVPDAYTYKFSYTTASLIAAFVSPTTTYAVDMSSYSSTDTYVIEVFAKTIGGNSTTAPAVDMRYKFSVRFPDETSKVFSGVLPGLTIGTAATAIPKVQIVKTTVAGVSTYQVTHIE
ncbi:MAG: hypothetical protein RIT03_817 [Bacteroidota bacterium]|jgi:hypothetical protein